MRLNDRVKQLTGNEFETLKKFVKRINIIEDKAQDLIFLPYDLVKIELPDLLIEGDFEKIISKLLKGIGSYQAERLSLQIALPFIFWVYDELGNIVKVEKEYLSSIPDGDLVNAGIDRLNELGEINLIDALAGGDILKWEDVKKLPYHIIFDKQRKMKLESDIQKDLARIQKDKSKQKK